MNDIYPNIESVVVKYLEGEPLTDSEASVLWKWLGSDYANRDLLFESKYMLHKPDDEAALDVTEHYNELVRRIAASAPPVIRPLRRSFGRRVAVFAASFMLALVLGSGAAWYFLQQPVPEPAYAHISAGPGDTSEIMLPDGTMIVLKPSSSISYPTSFRDKERRISLRGEAFLDVAKDPARPFIIESERQEVRVLGTSLNIMAYPGYGINQVTLLTGSVELSIYDGNGNISDSFLMEPNQCATFNLEIGSVDMAALSTNDAARSWIDNLYHFEKEPLSGIVKRLEHYYGEKIDIACAEAGSVLYSGTLSLDMSIEDVLSKFDNLSRFIITDALNTNK